jgi:pimeloyl-ACP methyl ester carboxylesterase
MVNRFCLLFAIFAVAFFPKPSPADEMADDITIELPVRDGQYEASPLSGFILSIETPAETNGIWLPLTAKTRAGLIGLEALKLIESFDINSNRILIHLNASQFRRVQSVLFPPHFLNIDEFNGQEKVVVLVHGLEGGVLTYRDLAPAFMARGWFPLQLVYPNDGKTDEPAKFLRSELERLHKLSPNTRFVIVAHSLGGLVSWDALSGRSDNPTGVTDLVTLGTPFNGSALAKFQSELEIADVVARILSKDWSGLDTENDGSGEAMQILNPESPERTELLARALPEGTRLHLVAGDAGVIERADQVKFTESIQRLIARLSPESPFATELQCLSTADELIIGLGDGAVTVSSAVSIKNHASQRVFHRNHSGLLELNDRYEDDELLNWILLNLESVNSEED